MKTRRIRTTGLLVVFCFAFLLSCDQRDKSVVKPVPVEEGFVETSDGTRLFYRKVGHGPQSVVVPADVFLHPAFDRLSEGRTLYYYDMRNRGLSDAVGEDRPISIQQDVLDLETVRAHFGLESIDLVGFSYLGLMVMMYANEHPQHVRRVVQLGPVAMRLDTQYPDSLRAGDYYAAMDTLRLAELRQLRAEGLPESDPQEYCRREAAVTRVALVGDPLNVTRLNQDICDKANEWPNRLATHFERHFVSIQSLQLEWTHFARFEGPVLTIHGRLDRNAAYGGGREWAMRLPDARLLTVRGGAHCSWADEPELVFGAIETFLDGAWPPQAVSVDSM